MEVWRMREILSQQYNGSLKWRTKVENMSDKQVIAIYMRMQREGSLR